MIIGTVREIKTGENRVGLTPAGAVLLEKGVAGVAYETVELDDGSLPLLL